MQKSGFNMPGKQVCITLSSLPNTMMDLPCIHPQFLILIFTSKLLSEGIPWQNYLLRVRNTDSGLDFIIPMPSIGNIRMLRVMIGNTKIPEGIPIYTEDGSGMTFIRNY